MPDLNMLDLSVVRFLVVDDNQNIRAIVKDILRNFNVQDMEESDNAIDALGILNTYDADIIITNWMMERMDGLDFVRRVRRADDRSKQMVPIVMISGFTEMKHVTRARDAGVTEFLAKPISPVALYLRIAEVIQRPRQFIRTDTFFGPDRHRHLDDDYDGPRRRQSDQVGHEAESSTDDIVEDQSDE